MEECAVACSSRNDCFGFSYITATPGGVVECHLSVNTCNKMLTTEHGSVYSWYIERN